MLNVTDDIRKGEIEWQAKLIAATVAYTIEDEKYRDNLLEFIQSKNMRGLPEDAPVRRADTSGDTRTFEEILEKGSTQQALARNLRRKGPGVLGMS